MYLCPANVKSFLSMALNAESVKELMIYLTI